MKNDSIERIAIANKNNTIYGKAAIECLKKHQLLTAVDHKLLEVTTLPQVSTYVVTGEVDVGFINASEAIAHADQLAIPVELPQSCYRPIDLSAVALMDRSQSEAATALLLFMKSDIAQGILKRHGL